MWWWWWVQAGSDAQDDCSGSDSLRLFEYTQHNRRGAIAGVFEIRRSWRTLVGGTAQGFMGAL
jgi:hypothetical protein